MSLIVTGSCPKCGSPIYVPDAWFSLIPPTPQFSCACNQTTKTVAVMTTTKQTDPTAISLLKEINTNLKELIVLVRALIQHQEQEVAAMVSGRIRRFAKDKSGSDGKEILCG